MRHGVACCVSWVLCTSDAMTVIRPIAAVTLPVFASVMLHTLASVVMATTRAATTYKMVRRTRVFGPSTAGSVSNVTTCFGGLQRTIRWRWSRPVNKGAMASFKWRSTAWSS